MRYVRLFVYALFMLFLSAGFGSSADGKNRQTLNLEPVTGDPHSFHCVIRFKTVDRVYLSTLLSAVSDGRERETVELRKEEWKYDPTTGVFAITREIDTSVYIPVADGKYETPLCVVLREKIDPRAIRFAINGRIGDAGKDYAYRADANEIKLLSCATGDENYMLQFKTKDGVSSVSQGNPSEVTRELRAYFEWPLEGNTVPSGTDGKRFAPDGMKFRGVWLVELIPVKNGYKGKSLQSGFTWDAGNNELVLDEPVDTSKYSVYVFGNE